MDVSENSGFSPPNHQLFNRVFNYFHHPIWGAHPYFGISTQKWVTESLKPKNCENCQGTTKKHHHHEANVLRGGNTLKEHPASALTLLFKKAKICAKARLEPKETSRFKKAENRQDMIDF